MPETTKETPLTAGTILEAFQKAKGTASPENHAEATEGQPKAQEPVQGQPAAKEPKAVEGGDWKKRVPSQYHADLEGLDGSARTKILDMIDGLDKPRQADYTKKTQAHAERLKKLESLEALAKDNGLENVEQVAEAVKFASQLYAMNPVIKVGDKEIRLRKEPEIPDLDTMSHDERVQWLQQHEAKVRAAEAQKAKAEIEKLEAERKQQDYLAKVKANFDALKKAKSEVTEEEWTEAQNLASSVREIMTKPDSGQTVEEVEAFFKPFLLAARASKAAKAAGFNVAEPAPVTSIDAPKSPTKALPKTFSNNAELLAEFKRSRGKR